VHFTCSVFLIANGRLGWEGLPRTNTPPYFGHSEIRFITSVPGPGQMSVSKTGANLSEEPF
jgi:hypothetical protein